MTGENFAWNFSVGGRGRFFCIREQRLRIRSKREGLISIKQGVPVGGLMMIVPTFQQNAMNFVVRNRLIGASKVAKPIALH